MRCWGCWAACWGCGAGGRSVPGRYLDKLAIETAKDGAKKNDRRRGCGIGAGWGCGFTWSGVDRLHVVPGYVVPGSVPAGRGAGVDRCRESGPMIDDQHKSRGGAKVSRSGAGLTQDRGGRFRGCLGLSGAVWGGGGWLYTTGQNRGRSVVVVRGPLVYGCPLRDVTCGAEI